MKDQNPVKFPVGADQIGQNLKLTVALMKDKRVSFFLKALFVGFSFIYLISVDFAPGLIDDAGVIYLFSYLFNLLSPREIVEETLSRKDFD